MGDRAHVAQQGKRGYVSVDMEGISGVSGDDQIMAGAAEYGCSRELMAADANAAIGGARLAGATDTLVNDSHGGQRSSSAITPRPMRRAGSSRIAAPAWSAT